MLKTFRVAVLIMAAVVLMATTASAFQVTNRSAEMTANSECDRAGTVKMKFDKTDWEGIRNYLLAGNKYAEIRMMLNGENLPVPPIMPTLCKDIKGSAVADGVPHSGELLELKTAPADISSTDLAALGFKAYVWGQVGGQVIYVYITAIGNAPYPADDSSGLVPWFRIGLDYGEDGMAGPGTGAYRHTICSQVKSFSDNALLTISTESTPKGLTFTGDKEIGHFIAHPISIKNCQKGEACQGPFLSEIALCNPTQEQACPVESTDCFWLNAGDTGWASDPNATLTIASNKLNQKGVYIKDVIATHGTDPIGVFKYYGADGKEITKSDACNNKKAVKAVASGINNSGWTAGVKICILYWVDVTEAVKDTNVNFGVEMAADPCGAILNDNHLTKTRLVACPTETTSSCFYFEYVLIKNPTWSTGIAISNLDTNIPVADMNLKFTLTDSTGAKFTNTSFKMTGNTTSFAVDDAFLAGFSGTPAAGPATLKVQALNFKGDGFIFLTDGNGYTGVNARWCSEPMHFGY